jgi:hypothetical protein
MNYQLLLLAAAVTAISSCNKSEESAKGTPPAPAPTFEEKIAAGPESAAKEVLILQDQLAEVMESITDAASAEKAIAKLGPIAEKFAKVGKVAMAMDKNISPETDARLKEMLKPSQARLTAANEKAMPVFTQNPELAKKLQEAMMKMQPKP